jgi:ATP synthase protein I
MSENSEINSGINSKVKSAQDRTVFGREVSEKAARKLRAQRDSKQGVWFGLGMMGLIGWSVVVPTLFGAWLGIWLDNRHPGKHSWALTLLIVGLAIGCLNAWHWVDKEDKEMRHDSGGHDE